MPIQIEIEQNALIIRANSSTLDQDDIEACASACRVREREQTVIVFDFSQVQAVTDDVLGKLVAVANTLAKENQKLFVLAHPCFANIVADRNLEPVFQCFIRQNGPTDTRVVPPPMAPDAEVSQINEILADAVIRVTQTMVGIMPRRTSLHLLGNDPLPRIDLAANIVIMGGGFKGSVMLGFPQQTFLNLVTHFTKKPVNVHDRAHISWAAELLNVSFGQLKTALNGKGYDFKPTIPSVIQGTDIRLLHLNSKATSVAKLESDAGEYFVITSIVG